MPFPELEAKTEESDPPKIELKQSKTEHTHRLGLISTTAKKGLARLPFRSIKALGITLKGSTPETTSSPRTPEPSSADPRTKHLPRGPTNLHILSSEDPHCFKCGESGHWGRNCPTATNALTFGVASPTGGNASRQTLTTETLPPDFDDLPENNLPSQPPLQQQQTEEEAKGKRNHDDISDAQHSKLKSPETKLAKKEVDEADALATMIPPII